MPAWQSSTPVNAHACCIVLHFRVTCQALSTLHCDVSFVAVVLWFVIHLTLLSRNIKATHVFAVRIFADTTIPPSPHFIVQSLIVWLLCAVQLRPLLYCASSYCWTEVLPSSLMMAVVAATGQCFPPSKAFSAGFGWQGMMFVLKVKDGAWTQHAVQHSPSYSLLGGHGGLSGECMHEYAEHGTTLLVGRMLAVPKFLICSYY